MLIYGTLLAAVGDLGDEIMNVEDEIDEVTTGSTGILNLLTNNPTALKFVILFVILIAIGLFIIFHPTEDNKKSAKKYLESMISKIYTIILANIDYVVDESTGNISIIDYEQFKKDILQMIYDDSWNFVNAAVDSAVSEGKLDFVAKSLIKKESVEAIVDLVMKRKDIQKMLKDAFETISNASINEMLKHDKEAAEEAAKIEEAPVDDPEPASTETVEAFAPTENIDVDSSVVEEEVIEGGGTEDIGEEFSGDGGSVG